MTARPRWFTDRPHPPVGAPGDLDLNEPHEPDSNSSELELLGR